MNPIVAKARMTCWIAHHGQIDRDGRPHAEHSSRVAMRCKSSVHKVIAYLHDVVEMTDTSIAEIEWVFGERVAIAVLALTWFEDKEKRSAYIDRVCDNYDAIIVKLADLADNLGRLESCKKLKRYRYEQEVLTLKRALRKKTYRF